MKLPWMVVLAAITATVSGEGGASGSEATDDVVGTPTYFVIPIEGGIGREFTSSRMRAYLEKAKSLRPTVVLLKVDMGGGSIEHAEEIVDLMIGHKDLHFVAHVRKALSAGATIALAGVQNRPCGRSTTGSTASSVAPSPKRLWRVGDYTRRAWGGRIMRRRECRNCGKRMTTWEGIRTGALHSPAPVATEPVEPSVDPALAPTAWCQTSSRCRPSMCGCETALGFGVCRTPKWSTARQSGFLNPSCAVGTSAEHGVYWCTASPS